MNTLYIKLIFAVIAVIALGSGVAYVMKLQDELEAKKTAYTELEGKFNRSQEDLLQATTSKDALVQATVEATKERTRIQVELNATLSKLRMQKPPVECKAAVDWAIENKHDLSF